MAGDGTEDITLSHRRGRNYRSFLSRFMVSGEEMELDDYYIFPEFQGRGIGSAVLHHCCDIDKPIMLYVFTGNHGAIALYRRFGFDISETVDTTRVIMRRAAESRQEVL